MYNAEIIDKKIENGRLSVTVLFENEKGEKFNDTFETTQYQDTSWIGKQIKRKLSHINSLPNVSEKIEVGPFNEIVIAKTDKEIYLEKSALYIKYMSVARMGLIQSDRKIILDLRDWLRGNFKDEYIHLF
ncbi:MAG: hypothetical protein IPJ53_18165 [Saprospiraceae bacterium]|nr:hypothetical protein [Candidatus Vicinibacter affinis]